jgi:LPXTG-motif cell wall-anchored protein
MVDGESVAAATEATVAFTEGLHEVTYGLSFDHGARVQRRLTVRVTASGMSPILLAAAGAVPLIAGLLLVVVRRRRRPSSATAVMDA